jgi:glutathione S-transferase
LDGEIGGRGYLASERYTMADIVAQTTFDFARFVGVDIPDACPHLRAWYDRVSARPSATYEVPEALAAAARAARG